LKNSNSIPEGNLGDIVGEVGVRTSNFTLLHT
jgi:hypothetical protein